MLVNPVQYSNAALPMVARFSENATFSRPVQQLKVLSPIEVTVDAQLMVFSPTQSFIRNFGIAVVPSSKVTVSRFSLL